MKLRERGSGKENDRASVISHNIRYEGRIFLFQGCVLKAVEKLGVGGKG
jgi:hypothetical protein